MTIAHDHAGMEEFLILEGDLVDSDGTTFGPGDFVSYDAGTHHNSWTEAGCLLAVFEWREVRIKTSRSAERVAEDPTPPRSGGLQGSSRSGICARRILICANEKGGVVRRPFSKLQA